MEHYYCYKIDSHAANFVNYTLVPRDIIDWDETGVGEKFRMYREASAHHKQDKNRDNNPKFEERPLGREDETFEPGDEASETWHQYHNPGSTEGGRIIRLESRSPRRSFLESMIDDIIQRVECDMICDECIREQGDCDVLYGGLETTSASDRIDGYSYHDSEGMIPDLVCGGGCGVNYLEPMRKQSDGDILIFGMESYNTSTRMNRYLYDQRSRTVGVHRSRVHPIRRPCWWIEAVEEENVGALRQFETGILEEPQPSVLSEEGPWNWSVWAEGLAISYADKTSVRHAGEGSVEYLGIQVLPPKPTVWRRGCPCDIPVHHTTIGLGGWNVFDGPSWVMWEMLSTWTAVLMLFVYWDFMCGGRARRKREDDERRKQKQKRAEKLKKS